MKLAIGRFGSCNPARLRRTASAYGGDSLVLTDDSLVEFFLQMEQFLTLALHHPAYWYSRPAAYNLGNIVSSNFLRDHGTATLRTSSAAS